VRKSAVYTLALLSFPVRDAFASQLRRVLSVRRIRVLLVFGLSRSGTTFLAEALTLGNGSAIKIHEPVKKLLRRSYRGGADRRADDADFWEWVFEPERIPWKVHLLVCTIAIEALRGSDRLLCIKPISMSDCVAEAAAATGGSVVYISRHPCGRSDSLIRQRMLDAEAPRPDRTALEAMGRQWGSMHADFKRALEYAPDWLWLKFEDVCAEPVAVLQTAYEHLGLEWTDEVEREIEKMTSTASSDFYGTLRNSRDQIDKWEKSLGEDEVEAIRSGTRPFEIGLYEGF
jgi:hypothetical protein